jgi:group I intron endonuclease
VIGVYKITNIVNGKVYIGSSADVDKRFSSHLRTLRNSTHRNVFLQRSWWKYGEESFEFTVIEEVLSEDSLLIREQAWIDKLKCYQKEAGYNICAIAGRTTGYKHTEKSRKLLSKLAKERYEYPDFHLKKYQLKKGHKMSEETIEKLRNAPRPTGEDSSRAKLTNQQVEDIVELILQGHNDTQIAPKYGVTRKTISNIRNRKSFKRVTDKLVIGDGPVREACQFKFTGSDSPLAKLNEDKVVEIKKLLTIGLSIAEIARKYDVSWTLIKRIKEGTLWTHVNTNDTKTVEDE